MNFNEHYYLQENILNEVEKVLTEEHIDKSFIVRLIDYLEKKTSIEYGTFDNNIYNEIRKVFPTLDNEKIKKIKKKIHDIILKNKHRFLQNVQNRIEKIDIPTGKEETNETVDQIKELSMLNKNEGDSAEKVFQYLPDNDTVHIKTQIIKSFLDRFGLVTDLNKINFDNDTDVLTLPIDSQLHNGSLNTPLIIQMIEELKDHIAIDDAKIDEKNKTLNIYFLKRVSFH